MYFLLPVNNRTRNNKGGELVPRKNTDSPEVALKLADHEDSENKIDQLNHMLAAVLNYISDDEVEEIDIEYILENTEGLREWWEKYRENNRKKLEKEIKESLSNLSLEELESIHEKIKDK